MEATITISLNLIWIAAQTNMAIICNAHLALQITVKIIYKGV